MPRLTRMLAVAAMVGIAMPAQAGWEDRSTGERVGYTALAAVQNVVPVTSAFAAPRCLPGYIPCKFSFAFFSVVAAGEQLLMSGGADLEQTKALVNRGFGGDWYLTGAHAAGDVTPEVLPEVGQPAAPGREPEPGAGSGTPRGPDPSAGSGTAP